MHILVVDDDSPDGTSEAVESLKKQFKNIHLITGKKKGLGAAYIRGMIYALDELHAEAVMEMDADFSHKPEDMKRLIKELDTHDFVIGSRYVPGGSIPTNWTFIRRMNSKWGNIFARYVAGLYHVHDCTAGFRAIRGDLLRKIDLKHLRVKGYSFQMNLLRAAVDHGGQVKEVPVDFIDRTVGESKLQLSDQLEFIFAAWFIRFERMETFLKFAIVGGSGVVVNLGALYLLREHVFKGGDSTLDRYLASGVAIELSIITNFILNNFWTFSARNNSSSFGLKGLKFNAVSFISLGISITVFILLEHIFSANHLFEYSILGIKPERFQELLAQAVGIVPAIVVNYFLNSYWTWKGK